MQRLGLLLAILLTVAELPLAYIEGSVLRIAVLAICAFGGWWWIDRRGRQGFSSRIGTAGVLLAAGIYFVHEWIHSHPVLAISHFIVVMAALKFVQPRAARDYGQLIVLALLLLVIGGVVNETLAYAVCLSVFLTIGLYAVIVLHFEREIERVQQRRRQAGLPEPSMPPMPPLPSVRRVTALAALGTFFVGAVLFLVFPRLGSGLFDAAMPVLAASVTGYAPNTSFDQAQRISESDAAVMRVVLSMDGEPINDPDFVGYFRGNTADLYLATPRADGRVFYQWERTKERPAAVELSALLESHLASVKEPIAHVIAQHYWIEDLRQRYLFAIYPPMNIRGAKIGHYLDHYPSDDTLSVRGGVGGTLDYVVESATPYSATNLRLPARRKQPEPQLAPDSPVRKLVERIVGGLPKPAEPESIASAIEKYLSSRPFTYTLDNSDVNLNREPVEELLFRRRRGHCEYFATAMTVMCQLAGLDARFVTGYRGGVYNAIGGYYQVRQRDAHAWVEVLIPSRECWVVFDPSPASAQNRAVAADWLGVLRQYVDNLEFQWLNFVVAYSTQNQGKLKERVDSWISAANNPAGSGFGRLWAMFRSFALGEGLNFPLRIRYWALLIALVGLSILWLRLTTVLVVRGSRELREVWRARRTARVNRVEFYERLLRRLARAGFTRRTHQTPWEFAQDVMRTRPEWSAVGQLTRLYYEARFGAGELNSGQTALIRRLVDSLG
jgi:transglutaminase-like putative cysteine protease